MVSAISSKYVFNKLDGKAKLYDNLVNQCDNHPNDIEGCFQRYKYRGDTLANYIIPSILIRSFDYFHTHYSKELNFEQVLSLSIFKGYALLFLSSCLIAIIVSLLIKRKSAKILTFVGFMSIIISSNHLFEFQWYLFSDLFFQILGDGYMPTIYVPRGAAAMLLLPITISILYNKPKILLLLLLFSSLIHTGYSQIFALFSLIIVVFILVLNSKEYLRSCIYLIIYNIALSSYIAFQLNYGARDIIEFNFINFSVIKIASEINYQTIFFLFFCIIILKSGMSSLLKKTTIIAASAYSILLALEIFSKLEILTYSLEGGNLSERMNGVFMYILVTFMIFSFGTAMKELYLKNFQLISKVGIVFVLLVSINMNFTYLLQWTKLYSNPKYYQIMFHNFKKGHSKIEMVKNDMNIYLNERLPYIYSRYDKPFEIHGNLHWL